MATGFVEGSSNSRKRKRIVYEVFLSFRGEDVRKTFIGHLHRDLKQRGINTFYYDSGLPRGDDIQSKLYEAIETSKLSIVTFSPTYATSRWCLDELVKIMECKESHGHIVLPVFFGVDPTHLRKQSGPYQEAFDGHEKDFESHRVDKWRQTLKSVADLVGFCLHNKANGYEVKLIEHIIMEVVKKLDARRLSIPKHMVGYESLVERIRLWLQNGSSEVEVGIIHGIGGIGKTTTAKVVYNSYRHQFESSSFLADIRSAASQKDENVIRLQEQLIFNISGNEAIKIYNVHEGKEMIRKVIGPKKILVVLDDIDEVEQFKAMFGCPEWFFPGSKILITTRNQHLLNAVVATTVSFEVRALNVKESTKLFCHHAFGESYPLHDYIKTSKLFIEYCGGLPLALEVLASSLRNKTLEMWERHYVKLKDFPNKTVHNVLKLSFDSLDDSNDEDIFLHIAFFMIGMKTSLALTILEGCGLHGMIGLENLTDKCLVSVDELRGTLMMHHLIQQMAYEVVREKAPDELGQRSRLIGQKDTSQVLRKKMGTSAVKGLQLDFPSSNESKPFKTGAFTKMCNLDLLLLGNVQLEGDFKDFPTMIKWILWRGFTLESIPLYLELDALVVLDMQASCLVNAWMGSKGMGALKILDLSYSLFLICTPDLSGALMLERLFLKGCVNLIDVHESIGSLSNLKHLNFEGCERLVTLHQSVGNLKKLSILNLEGCKSLVSFHIPISVVELNLGMCNNLFMAGNEMGPSAIGVSNSDTIPLANPCSLFNFNHPFLTELRLKGCGISRDDVFELLSCAPSLRIVYLKENPIRMLSNKNMHPFLKLRYLSLSKCTQLKSISQLPRTCELITDRCSSLRTISYIYDPELTPRPIHAAECAELVEVDYGCNDRLALKLIEGMYEGQANQLCFPNFQNFVFGSILENTEDKSTCFDRGLYRAGTYQAYHLGDILATWFNTIATDSELLYTVPSNELGIRLLNLGFVGSWDDRVVAIKYVKIKNLTSKWEWQLDTPSGKWLYREVTLTWLSHWCVMEHREINPGDLLHISVKCSDACFIFIKKWGIEIIYEEQHVDEDSNKEHDDDDMRKTGNPCSGSNQRRIMNMSGETTPFIDEDEEKVDDSGHPSLVDLSIYESKYKPREYRVPYRIYVVPLVMRHILGKNYICKSRRKLSQKNLEVLLQKTEDSHQIMKTFQEVSRSESDLETNQIRNRIS